jgi:hypothetical protein
MELILSAISSGGLVGAANQYACLLILSIAAKLGWVTVSSQMDFISSYWFMAIVGVFWLLTLLPAFASFLAPGVLHAVNTVTNFLSGFVVPISSALLGLASVGIISNINPDMKNIIDTLHVFNPNGTVGTTGMVVAGASGVAAVTMTAMKAIAKPGISASTGTTGTISAPIFAVAENIASIVFMFAAYLLTKMNPWLLVALGAFIFIALAGLVAFALYQLWRLHKGIGRVLYLAQVNPRAGLLIFAEFFLWGIGWLVWKQWARGLIMLFFFGAWVAILIFVVPILSTLFLFFPPLVPIITTFSIIVWIMVYFGIGLTTSKALLKYLEPLISDSPVPAPEGMKA